ncbi:MAG: 30S ribosomal protein S7 [Candidatus Margulisbacteria bacterium]|nr:30S ribosomal protein S7 [Candidatus Margulisiibacteriota bacterium]
MPRYGRVPKRKKEKDAVYQSEQITNFINKIMIMGKKSKAETIVYKALEQAEARLKKPAIEIFAAVIKNVSPLMEVKSRRVGGATYQVPIEVPRARSEALAMLWLKEGARSRKGKSMAEKLSEEMVEAFNNTGVAVKKREDMHRTAESNKAFAHFRW